MNAVHSWAAVAMGGSAGSIEALSALLAELPSDFPLPILAVVHLPPDKKSVLSQVIQTKCKLRVCEAQDKEPIEKSTVYFAPPDYHLLVEEDGYLSLSYDEPVWFSRPSIDVLLESAADVYGPRLIGIVLSGANHDGAKGLKKVENEGGFAMVQSPREAFAPTMPLAALAECPGAMALTSKELGTYLRDNAT